MSNVAVSIRPDAVPAQKPELMLSGTMTALRSDLVAALGLPAKSEGVRGVNVISMSDAEAKNGYIGSLIVESFLVSTLAQIGCSAEILAAVNAQLQTYGRTRGSVPLAAALFLNENKQSGHRYVGIKCDAFVGAQQ